jgi:hypothetical protein
VFGALTHTRLSFVELLLCFVRFLFFYCGWDLLVMRHQLVTQRMT